MEDQKLNRLAEQFTQLGEQFDRFERRDVEPSHLLLNIEATADQAGRLLREAIDDGFLADLKRMRTAIEGLFGNDIEPSLL